MKRRILEDFLLNKLNGYYLILSGNDHPLASRLVFQFSQVIIALMVFAHLIPPRHHP